MSAPTVAVTCTAFDQNGNPVAGAAYRAKLNQTEIYNGFVVPEVVDGEADANGACVLQLWPNALGVAGSLYAITAVNPDTGKKFLNATVAVPNSACNLHEILVQEPYPAIDAAQQALIAAQSALADVTAQSALAVDAGAASELAAAASLLHAQSSAQSRLAAALDAGATAADRTQTALDRAQTTADRAQATADRTQTVADRAQTGSDRAATAADRTQTGLDRAATTSSAGASLASANASEVSRQASVASAGSAATAKTAAETARDTAQTQAGIATTKAGEAATSATTAATKAAEASASAAASLASRNTAEGSATTATGAAATATTQAGIATTKAGEASASAGSALTHKNAAGDSAVAAASSAATADAKADEASASAVAALASQNAAGASEDNAADSAAAAALAASQATGVTSIAGFSGAVTKAQLALDQVSNTPDSGKPVSAAQALADTAARDAAIAASAPVAHVGSGGASHAAATTTVAGFMSAADKTKLNGIATSATANTGTVTGVTATLPLSSTGGTAPVISIAAATTSVPGSMSATDKAKLDGIATSATANSADATLLARANHTGSQSASTISNFDTQVRTNRLDQMSTPAAAVNMGSQVLSNVATPTLATDAVNKGYVDALVNSTDWKASVRAASTADIAALSGLLTIDGITLVANDRVLVKNQATASLNGIYTAASGAWVRAADADASAEVTSGLAVMVTEGITNGDTLWVLATNDTIVLGATALVFTQIGGAAAAAMNLISTSPITAGTAMIDCSIDPALYAKIIVRILFMGSSTGTLQAQLMGATEPLATNYNATFLTPGGTALTGASGTTSIAVPGDISPSTSFRQRTTVEATLHDSAGAPFTASLMNISTGNAWDNACRFIFGSNTTSGIVKGIRLFPSAGTFQSGSVTVWGVKK